MHQVFVYGTLKRGYPNFDPIMKGAEFVGRYRTIDPYPLVIGGPWHTPYLIDEAGKGRLVLGELFLVDDDLLGLLDEFEGVHLPESYRREKLSIIESTGEGQALAWCYLRARRHIDGIHRDNLEEYPLDSGYVIPSLRSKSA